MSEKMNNLFNGSRRLRDKLKTSPPALGLFHLASNAVISEALSVTPIDWLAYDMEASPSDKMSLVHFLQSLKGSDITSVVRTESSAVHHLEQVLDTGICAIIVPKIESKQQCIKVADAVRYPPEGKRGVNPVRASNYLSNVKDYFSSANDEVLVFVQIESITAVKNVEEILSVKGIDGIFIGCGDLAMDMGYPAQMDNEKLLAAISTVLTACQKANKVPGIFAYNAALAEKFIKDGFKMVAFGNDIAMLQKAVTNDYNHLSKISKEQK